MKRYSVHDSALHEADVRKWECSPNAGPPHFYRSSWIFTDTLSMDCVIGGLAFDTVTAILAIRSKRLSCPRAIVSPSASKVRNLVWFEMRSTSSINWSYRTDASKLSAK